MAGSCGFMLDLADIVAGRGWMAMVGSGCMSIPDHGWTWPSAQGCLGLPRAGHCWPHGMACYGRKWLDMAGKIDNQPTNLMYLTELHILENLHIATKLSALEQTICPLVGASFNIPILISSLSFEHIWCDAILLYPAIPFNLENLKFATHFITISLLGENVWPFRDATVEWAKSVFSTQ